MNGENGMELVVDAQIEDEQSTALVQNMDQNFVQKVEAIAKDIVSVRKSLERIVCEMTYRDDWTIFDDKAGLGSAGAERLLKAFPFKFSNWSSHKEEWHDDIGPGYRWIYKAECELWGSKVLVTGQYGTRDKFLGKAHGKWKSFEEINENEIQKGAQHICTGAGIKALLGLRNMPVKELNRIYGELNREGEQTKSAGYEKKPPSNGNGVDLSEIKKKVAALLNEWTEGDVDEMKRLLEQYSSFETKEGKTLSIKSISACKNAKWLATTYGKMKKDYDELEVEMESIDNDGMDDIDTE